MQSLLALVKKESEIIIPSVNRYVYVGEYKNSDMDGCAKLIEVALQFGKRKKTHIPITGLLIIYPEVIVHYLECSEEFMKKHCTYLQTPSVYNPRQIVIHFKLLYAKHSIFTRMFEDWTCVDAETPNVADEVEDNSIEKNQDIMRTICVLNMFHLATVIQNFLTKTSKDILENHISQAIPRKEMIKFLLKSEYFPNFRQILPFLEGNGLVKNLIVWPSHHNLYAKGQETKKTSQLRNRIKTKEKT